MTERAQKILDAARKYCAAGGVIAPRKWNIVYAEGKWKQSRNDCPICPLSAYLVVRQPPRADAAPRAIHTLKVELGVAVHPTGYVAGFTAAIDDRDEILESWAGTDWGEARRLGHADGLAVREALVAEGLLQIKEEA